LLQFDDEGLHLLRGELNADHGLVLDLLHSLGELERLDCLLQVAVLPTGGTDKGCLGVTAETLLQQLGEGRFSEWNIATFAESLDDTTKHRQGQIDLLGFLEDLARGSSLGDTLRTSQVDQVELGVLLGAVLVDLVVLEHQDGVATAAPVIHASGLGVHSVLSFLDVVENCLRAVDHHLVGVDDLATHHLQVVGRLLVWLEQIVEALLVNLKIVHH